VTQAEARAWLHRFGDTPDADRHACEYGHGLCSVSPWGACHDDVIRAAINPVDDDGENWPG